ncbi:sulfurtransferase TusA family protein [Photobacterium alginatilyticum]|jgi:TusA-related sulfurtransferase
MDNNCQHTGMETPSLNLTSERCPMALLLAKRATKVLCCGQRLKIHISDQGARQDIPRYLLNHGFDIEQQAACPQELVIIVTKRQ